MFITYSNLNLQIVSVRGVVGGRKRKKDERCKSNLRLSAQKTKVNDTVINVGFIYLKRCGFFSSSSSFVVDLLWSNK